MQELLVQVACLYSVLVALAVETVVRLQLAVAQRPMVEEALLLLPLVVELVQLVVRFSLRQDVAL
jgi:hypothetical protein